MNWYVLWFVLAGAILGFALSTLWEWLYFRPKRLVLNDARIVELEAQLRACQQQQIDLRSGKGYAGGGALLETEEAESLSDMLTARDDVDARPDIADELDSDVLDPETGQAGGSSAPSAETGAMPYPTHQIQESEAIESDKDEDSEDDQAGADIPNEIDDELVSELQDEQGEDRQADEDPQAEEEADPNGQT